MIKQWEQPHHDYFYTCKNVLKDNPHVVISIGERGVGKSLSWKLRAIYDFLNGKGRTIYVRRFKKELKQAKTEFLGDIFVGDKRLEKFKFEIKGDNLLIDGKIAITFIPLSQVLLARSVAYQDVVRIIFDEFLTMGRTLDDLGYDEIQLFNDYLDTVFRTRDDVQIVLLANAITTTSAYFEMFGFDRPINTNRRYQNPNKNLVKLWDKVVLEIIKNEKYREVKRDSTLMGILSDSKYKAYSIDNQFSFEDDRNIIDERTIRGRKTAFFKILTGEMVLTLQLVNNRKQEYLLTDRVVNDDVEVYTFDKELILEGAIYVGGMSRISEMLQGMIISNRLYYSSMKVKKEFLMNLRKIVRAYF